MFLRSALLMALLALSACEGGVMTAPDRSDCDFFGNCRCQDWYSNCSIQ